MTRLREAIDQLEALLVFPYERGGAWEAPYVSAFEDELRAVLAILRGGDQAMGFCARRQADNGGRPQRAASD